MLSPLKEGYFMKRTKSPCPVCSTAISKQGLTAHLRYKHPNYEPMKLSHNGHKPPVSVAIQDFENWKDAFAEGVIVGMRRAG
jgi:hypothetical protein